MRAKASVIGHFGIGQNLLNGQTIKTKIVTEELEKQLGEDKVLKFDTHGGWKSLLKAPFQAFRALKNSENVIIFPAHNGVRVYAPLLSIFRRAFKGRRLHYVVIGGWLPQFLEKHKGLAKTLKKFDALYVETTTMKNALEAQGFTNVHLVPNCKQLDILNEEDLVYPTDKPYKLCTFSRVMREKGIEDAIEAVSRVNKELGYTAYTLDIYGQVDAGQTEWFEELKASFPDFVSYGGLVPFDKSVEVLKDYFALLFPTRFYTEGVPGTIIDGYAAGVPVISARWESFADVVDDGKTGIGYEVGSVDELTKMLKRIADEPAIITSTKVICLNKAKNYLPLFAIKPITNQIGG